MTGFAPSFKTSDLLPASVNLQGGPHDPVRPRAEDSLGLIIGRRKAAISALKIRRWETAFVLLCETFRLTKPEDNALRIGLMVDAGLAGLRAGKGAEAMEIFLDAIEMLATVPNTTDIPKNFRIHKFVGHAITELSNSDSAFMNRKIDDLPPCFCSSFEMNNSLLELPPTPIDITLLNLFEFGITASLVSPRLHGAIELIRDTRSTMLRFELASAEARYAALEGNLDDVPLRAAELSRIAAAYHLMSDPITLTHFSDPPSITDSVDTGFILTFMVSALLVRVERSEVIKIPPNWLTPSVPSAFHTSVLEAIKHWPYYIGMSSDKRASAKENCSSNLDRAIICINVIIDSNASLDEVLEAHTHLLRMLVGRSLVRDVAAHVCRLMMRFWRSIAEQPFLLISPRFTQSALKAACDEGVEGESKAATILLAALDAVGRRLPSEVEKQFRQVASPGNAC